jgi:hypothetical protein
VSSFWSRFSKNRTSTGRLTTLPIAPEAQWGPLEIDPKTSLPALPKGFGWSVTPSTSSESVKVMMVHKYDGDWTAVDHDSYIYTAPNMTTIGAVASTLYERHLQTLQKKVEVQSVIGIYETSS